MAADTSGSTKVLTDSRAEALQALVNSLASAANSTAETPSREDVSRLSDKLKELLGDSDLPQVTAQHSELLNEEGLPIIEITEPTESVSESAPGASLGTASVVNVKDAAFMPMFRLPPEERARNRMQMDRILDILEEEERVEEERSQTRDRERLREELEQRKANAKAELERIKAMKDVQKKMGKALLKNMADAREKEEKEKARQEKEDLELEETRRSRKPRKCVSWAELPQSEKGPARRNEDDSRLVDGTGSSHRLPMRPHVVERFPTRSSGVSSPPPPVPMDDSDDESNPPSPVLSDSDRGPFTGPDSALSDGSRDSDEAAENQASEDEFDIDTMQHQREIALAYFEKRNTIGADAARAMSAHSHDVSGEDDWEREDVPLEATLSRPPPKPSQSKFKSERLAQAYGTHIPSSTPSTSLGPSVLPNSSGALRSSVHTGKLHGDRLIRNSDSDDDDDHTRAFMDALRRGQVTNAGAAENSDALVEALESAYATPSKSQHPPAPLPPTTTSIAAPATVPQRISKFKLARVAPQHNPPTDESLREGGAQPPNKPPLPMNETVIERTSHRKPLVPPSRSSLSSSSQSSTVLPPPPIIVDSPSFPPAPAVAMAGGGSAVIIDSPPYYPPSTADAAGAHAHSTTTTTTTTRTTATTAGI